MSYKYKLNWVVQPLLSVMRFKGWPGYIRVMDVTLENLEEMHKWLKRRTIFNSWFIADTCGNKIDVDYALINGIDLKLGCRIYFKSKDDAMIFIWGWR